MKEFYESKNSEADAKARVQSSISVLKLTNVKNNGDAGTAEYHTDDRVYDAVRAKKRGDKEFRWYLTGDYSEK